MRVRRHAMRTGREREHEAHALAAGLAFGTKLTASPNSLNIRPGRAIGRGIACRPARRGREQGERCRSDAKPPQLARIIGGAPTAGNHPNSGFATRRNYPKINDL
jgi:hypothetical protein